MCSYSILYGSLRSAASTEPISSTYKTWWIELSKGEWGWFLQWRGKIFPEHAIALCPACPLTPIGETPDSDLSLDQAWKRSTKNNER